MTIELWLRTRAAKYRGTAKCSGFGNDSRKAAKLRPLLARSYTRDSSPGKSAATGDRADAARPGCFAAPTAPRSDGRVPEDREQGGVSRVGRLAMNVMLLVKTSRIK